MSNTAAQKELQRRLDLAWLNLTPEEVEGIQNPLKIVHPEDLENPHLFVMRALLSPENFYFTCKSLFNIELHPFQVVILREFWKRKFPMFIANRGAGKTFIEAVYCMLVAILKPGSRIVIVGAGFRQAKLMFDYCEQMYFNSPVLQSIMSSYGGKFGPSHDVDKWSMYVGSSTIIAIPMGTGEKVRGIRATLTIADEFAAQNIEVYENVVAAFGIVKKSPVEEVKIAAKNAMLVKMGIIKEGQELFTNFTGNQTIISGTGDYYFNHFYRYWKKYKQIIESRGDYDKLADVFPEGVDNKFDYRDYSIIRMPQEVLPFGYMDEKEIARLKATLSKSNYLMEVGATFISDSDGFFRRSLIESCTGLELQPIHLSSGPVSFSAKLRGDPNLFYVLGCDPASEKDNFSIVIIEIHKDHRRVVYCWTTNREKHRNRVMQGVEEQDFYGYCARKIRNLMAVFNIQRIALDSQGGGVAVEEALHDTDKLKDGDVPVWQVIDREKPKDSDGKAGLHIIELVNFASSEWTSLANHGLRKDFEDKQLLMPFLDTVGLAIAFEDDSISKRNYDTLEDAAMEIEEMKNELTTIVHTRTTTGRDHWDTPETKLPNGKKGRQKKDRYSALLMANMVARTLARMDLKPQFKSVGGFANKITKKDQDGRLYEGPEWFTSQVNGKLYGMSVKREGQ